MGNHQISLFTIRLVLHDLALVQLNMNLVVIAISLFRSDLHHLECSSVTGTNYGTKFTVGQTILGHLSVPRSGDFLSLLSLLRFIKGPTRRRNSDFLEAIRSCSGLTSVYVNLTGIAIRLRGPRASDLTHYSVFKLRCLIIHRRGRNNKRHIKVRSVWCALARG